jgi:hypothetical protein
MVYVKPRTPPPEPNQADVWQSEENDPYTDIYQRREYDKHMLREFPGPFKTDPGSEGPPDDLPGLADEDTPDIFSREGEAGLQGVKDALLASARSKAQFRFLQGQRRSGDRMTPEQAEEMLAPPEDPLSGQPFRKYQQFLPERAEDGPDPFEDWNKQMREIARARRGGA